MVKYQSVVNQLQLARHRFDVRYRLNQPATQAAVLVDALNDSVHVSGKHVAIDNLVTDFNVFLAHLLSLYQHRFADPLFPPYADC